jgi:hypothetical protein
MRSSLHVEEQGMKFAPIFCLCLIAAAIATPAAADPFERGTGFRPFVQDQRPRPEPQRDADRPPPPRDTRAPGEAERGRMSPDERRQLRRDIQDAGKDIYHRDRPAPRRDQRR